MTQTGVRIEERLGQLAAKATPGPWEYLGPSSGWSEDGELHPFVLGPNGENPICHVQPDWQEEQANAAYIAACHPGVVALLARIAGAYRELRVLSTTVQSMGQEGEVYYEAVVNARKRADDALAALDRERYEVAENG